MIFPALSELFSHTVEASIADDLHTDDVIRTAEHFLQLLSKIAPYTPLPSAEELAADYLNRL